MGNGPNLLAFDLLKDYAINWRQADEAHGITIAQDWTLAFELAVVSGWKTDCWELAPEHLNDWLLLQHSGNGDKDESIRRVAISTRKRPYWQSIF